MTSDTHSSCSMELDPNTNPLFSVEDHYTMFQEDSLIQIGEEKGNDVTYGIAAADVSSLLEQFEEASNSLGEFESKNEEINFGNEKKAGDCSSGRSTPTKDILDKIKSKQKTKSAILLPMGMPSKRGRGSAVTMPTTCATPKMKRILLQTSVDKDIEIQKEKEPIQPISVKAFDSNNKEIINVNVDYYMGIVDHDYCVNVPKIKVEPLENPEHYPEDDVLILEDGEVLDGEYEEVSDLERQLGEDSGIADTFFTSEKSRQQRSKRNYRSRREESPVQHDSEKYFNKIPSYYTALSLNSAKPPKKSAQVVKAPSYTLHVQDFFEPNPAPKSDNSVYNKLPAYYSCFTNSTKYDSADGDSKLLECSQESKSSSGYSSRSHSPHVSESSGDLKSTRDRFESYSNRSKSRDLKIRGRRGRSRKRRRRGSYSSSSRSRSRSSSSSSSSSSYSRSRSRARNRSRSYSRSDYSSRSRSRSYSRSRSRSISRSQRFMSSRSRSREREREERKKIRDEEKLQQMKERRIVYVGKIPDSYTKRALRRRFERFGAIEEVSVHFRENGDNYGFVTFEYRCDAYAAVEKGNDVPDTLKFDLCFGGRRQFCEVEYADLDGINEVEEEYYPLVKKNQSLDFDELLRQAKASRHKN